jgi:hypothetical protein
MIMGALGEIGTRIEVVPNAGIKLIQVVTADTVIGGTDTLTVDLSKYGCRNLHAILGFDETTTGSIVVQQQPTTSVTAGVLTITTTGSDTGVKTFYIWAY